MKHHATLERQIHSSVEAVMYSTEYSYHACMHACMHTYIHTYIYTYMHAYIHTHIHTYIYTYMHAYIHTHTYIYIYIYTCMHTYIHTYIPSHIFELLGILLFILDKSCLTFRHRASYIYRTTAPLTSRCCIIYIYSTNINAKFFKHGSMSPSFLFKMLCIL
jgi:hypothetical protein